MQYKYMIYGPSPCRQLLLANPSHLKNTYRQLRGWPCMPPSLQVRRYERLKCSTTRASHTAHLWHVQTTHWRSAGQCAAKVRVSHRRLPRFLAYWDSQCNLQKFKVSVRTGARASARARAGECKMSTGAVRTLGPKLTWRGIFACGH